MPLAHPAASGALFLALCLQLTPAAANEVPTLDVERSCRDAAVNAVAANQPPDKATYDGCMQQESDTRATLVKEWASFPQAQREICLSETRGIGLPSYVELYECLSLDKETKGATGTK